MSKIKSNHLKTVYLTFFVGTSLAVVRTRLMDRTFAYSADGKSSLAIRIKPIQNGTKYFNTSSNDTKKQSQTTM